MKPPAWRELLDEYSKKWEVYAEEAHRTQILLSGLHGIPAMHEAVMTITDQRMLENRKFEDYQHTREAVFYMLVHG